MSSPQNKKDLAFISEFLEEAEQSIAQYGRSFSMAEWPTVDLSSPLLSPLRSIQGSRQSQSSNDDLDSSLVMRTPSSTPLWKAELESPIRFIGRSPFMPATPGPTRSCSALFCSSVVSDSETFCSACRDMYTGSPPRREEIWQWSSPSVSISPARSSEAGTSKSPTRRHRSPSPDPIADLVLISPPGVRVDINVVSPRLGAMEALASEVGDADEETINSSSTDAGEQSTFEESPLATSIPLPESDSEAEAEEGEGEQPQASTSNEGFSSFTHPDAPAWQWKRESAVKRMIDRPGFGDKADSTTELEDLFPPEQRHVQLADGKYRCWATAGLDKATDRWSVYRCKHTAYKHLNDYRRHLTSKHLGDERAEVRHPKNQAVGTSHKPKKRKTRKDDDDEWEGGRRGKRVESPEGKKASKGASDTFNNEEGCKAKSRSGELMAHDGDSEEEIKET
ncbi:hypothetical protein M408DRAFT_22454 [Serendipita vermifera MAFF 305830]|uniref:Uncharacterized protein n=1 Tax=Serendipita vermifera MAFF 305830 TaxID=933852 RepID=A0A0C2XM29_SERVB|nr:hypothetical protein M408DRAFT_22454 [Serendipita vermifera MAFF 305830]